MTWEPHELDALQDDETLLEVGQLQQRMSCLYEVGCILGGGIVELCAVLKCLDTDHVHTHHVDTVFVGGGVFVVVIFNVIVIVAVSHFHPHTDLQQ